MTSVPAKRLGLGLAVLAGLAACKTQTVIDEYRESTVFMEESDSIVVLGRRHDISHETEREFVDCVANGLSGAAPGVKVIPETEFVDAMYPWFEASTAPLDVAGIQRTLDQQEVAERVAEYGVRYVVWVDGSTRTTSSTGNITCAVGPGGGGCFGLKSWDDEAEYEASIWDLEDVRLSGKVSADATGTSFVPAIIIPVPLIARVRASACQGLSQQLAGFISTPALETRVEE